MILLLANVKEIEKQSKYVGAEIKVAGRYFELEERQKEDTLSLV